MMAKAFNSREGFTIKDDSLPQTALRSETRRSQRRQKIFEEKDFKQAVELFYDVTGCDPQTGRPIEEDD